MPTIPVQFLAPIVPALNYTVYVVNSNGTVDGKATLSSIMSLYSLVPADVKAAYESNADTNAFTDAEQTKLTGIEALADVTDAANVEASLSGAALTTTTVAVGDKVLVQDISNSSALRTVTTQAIADLKVSQLSEDTSPQLVGFLDTNGHQIQGSVGTNVASAFALTIPTNGNYFHVTGAVAISEINTVKVGTEVTLEFDSTPLLTYHATNLILPTAANITAQAGDVAKFVEYAAGDWKCISYQRADGSYLAGQVYTSAEQTKVGHITVTQAVSLDALEAKLDKLADIQTTLVPAGTTQTIDWNDGDIATVDLDSASGNVTLTLSNPTNGWRYIIKFIQGAVARTVILPASVKLAGGTAPSTLTITAVDNAEDTLELWYDGANYYGKLAQNFG